FHGCAGSQLQQRSSDHPRQEGQQQMIFKGYTDQQHNQGPAAVNRQKGAPHKTSVYPSLLQKRHIQTFPAPADEAVDIKTQQPLRHRIMIHVTLSFAVSSSEPYADLSPPRQPLLQVVPVKQEPWIVVISGIFMASFYTGSALDADSLIFSYIIRTDRSHGTDLCTKTAVVAVVRHQRFHL